MTTDDARTIPIYWDKKLGCYRPKLAGITDEQIMAAADAWAERENRYRPGIDTSGEIVAYERVILAFMRSPECAALFRFTRPQS